ASDALPADSDDRRLQKTIADNKRAARGIRRDNRGRPNRTRLSRGSGVHALEGRALDEASSHAGGVSTRPAVCNQERAENVCAHFSRKQVEDVSRSRRRTPGVHTVPRDPPPGKGVCLGSGTGRRQSLISRLKLL